MGDHDARDHHARDGVSAHSDVSRRQFLAGASLGALAFGLAGCDALLPSASPSAAASRAPTPTPTPTASASPDDSASPSASTGDDALRRRIAGLLVVGFRGLGADPDSPIASDIRDLGLGGVVLFDKDEGTGGVRNIDGPEQLRQLCADLQLLATDAQIGGPLIIAVDEEGGAVARLDENHGFPPTQSAAALGERNNPAVTKAAASTMAGTLATAGINLNLAPVVDLNINPRSPAIGALGRSFSADPKVVVAQAKAFIQGHRARGIATTLKHFPGHGSATSDTHKGVTDVTATWKQVELEPYRQLVAANLAECVLVAHVFNSKLDPDHPASLSKPTITGILRGQLKYGGVVITDDLGMGAITAAYGFEEALALALEAGADLLLLANQGSYDDGLPLRAVNAIAGFVASGRLTKTQIDDASRRVGALRAKLLPGPV